MHYQELNLKILDLSFNKLTTNVVGELLHSISNAPGKQPHHVQVLKLNNNLLGDDAAKYFAMHIQSQSHRIINTSKFTFFPTNESNEQRRNRDMLKIIKINACV